MIKQILNVGLLGCVAIGLTGCASQQYFDSTVNSWKGASSSALVGKWGYPTKTLSLASGKTYVYHQKQRITQGWYTHCHIYFTFDHAGKIVDVHSQGNDCIFTQYQYQALAYQPSLKK